jgi:zinc protease
MTVPLHLEAAGATPIVWFTAALRGGAGLDPVGREGLTRHAAELARRGAGDLGRAELDAAVDELGASLEVDVDRDSIALSGMALARTLPRLLELAAAVLGRPRLELAEHEQLVRETRHELDDLRDDDSSLADRFFNLRCAPGHPYGRTTLGTEATLAAIDLAAAREQRARLWSRDRLVVGFAGAIDPAAARDAADGLAEAIGGAGSPPLPELTSVESAPGLRIYVVDKPARSQCQMMLGHTGPRYGTGDFTALLPFETAFGGMFSSRLMQEIRVKRGWSYGAGCRLHRARIGSWFRIHLAPTAEVAADALRLVLDLYADVAANGLTDAEVDFARGYLTGSLALGRQTARQRMRQQLQHDLLGMPADYLPTLGQRIAAVSAADVRAAAARWLRPADVCVVVVATASQLVPRLEALGLAVTEVLPHDSY